MEVEERFAAISYLQKKVVDFENVFDYFEDVLLISSLERIATYPASLEASASLHVHPLRRRVRPRLAQRKPETANSVEEYELALTRKGDSLAG